MTSGLAGPDATAALERGLPAAVLRRILEYIDANCHRGPKLSELSSVAHMSAFHFARLFKRSTGQSPHRFVVARRIDHAKELLSRDAAPLAAIARAVGFRTASHFSTVFRRTTGMTPSAYRSATRGSLPTATASPTLGPVVASEATGGLIREEGV
jgi:AraC family transcriptional regulator